MIGPAARAAIVRVCRTTKTVIRLGCPVLNIVPGMIARPAQIRDLVVFVSSAGSLFKHPLVHHTCEIIIRRGLNPAANMFRQRGARMDLEQVKREMLGMEL